MSRFLTVVAVMLFALSLSFQAQGKPFKKALILGGGGISPGIALGIIAGARAAGYEPDVIITSCGSSLGAAIDSSFGNSYAALKYTRSEKFYKTLNQLVNLNSWFAFKTRDNLLSMVGKPEILPPVFEDTILKIPEQLPSILPNEKFPTSANRAKLIIIGSRASFGPEMVGKNTGTKPLMREVFFTDAKTAELLRGFESPVQKLFPYGRVDSTTETVSFVPMSQAVRVSITDPFYINPARIGESYYWGGAVDLFPIEVASELADEVLVNYPAGLYNNYEDLAISSVFGFAQSDRTQEAANQNKVKWIDTSGTIKLAMDPSVMGFLFNDNIPKKYSDFAALVDRQYKFGYQRGVEAVKLQKNKTNVRSHLREIRVGAK